MTGSVVVAIYDFPYEAQIARDNLELSGIPAVVANEHVASMQLGNSAGGIRLLVLAEHLERARLVLASDHSKDVADELDLDEEEETTLNVETVSEPAYIKVSGAGVAQHRLDRSTCWVAKASIECMRRIAIRPEHICWAPQSRFRESYRTHKLCQFGSSMIGYRVTVSSILLSLIPLAIALLVVWAFRHKPINSLSLETSQWLSYAFSALMAVVSFGSLSRKLETTNFYLDKGQIVRGEIPRWWPRVSKVETVNLSDLLAFQFIEILPTDAEDSFVFYELNIIRKDYTRIFLLGQGVEAFLDEAVSLARQVDKPLWIAKCAER
ncbi:DUF2007 domain-containing protein [Corallincola spongiicola]|uniref:DUF2007 domain-containing protein n=1 Tax=Corallincola spongiicola TaxID=2520508 RepID=A0ABY1WSU2_9GAMM|nr:DUF2007 domain-containing protein [Corallincola spongiicola]TAA47814.1 DUF2007 domain-containing protein [Corallincola spongiicola]